MPTERLMKLEGKLEQTVLVLLAGRLAANWCVKIIVPLSRLIFKAEVQLTFIVSALVVIQVIHFVIHACVSENKLIIINETGTPIYCEKYYRPRQIRTYYRTFLTFLIHN